MSCLRTSNSIKYLGDLLINTTFDVWQSDKALSFNHFSEVIIMYVQVVNRIVKNKKFIDVNTFPIIIVFDKGKGVPGTFINKKLLFILLFTSVYRQR